MHKSANSVILAFPRPEGNSSLNAFILYQDVDAGKRAKETCDLLAENLGWDWRLESELWSFRAMQVPRLREIAAQNAGSADIVVVSCAGGGLPAAVTAWLGLWAGRPNRAVALVGLFAPGDDFDAQARVHAVLSRAARRGGMKFFSPIENAVPMGLPDWKPLELFSAEGAEAS